MEERAKGKEAVTTTTSAAAAANNNNGESAATAAARAKLKTAEALLAQKRLYQRQLRSLQQTALARELMTSVRQRAWKACRVPPYLSERQRKRRAFADRDLEHVMMQREAAALTIPAHPPPPPPHDMPAHHHHHPLPREWAAHLAQLPPSLQAAVALHPHHAHALLSLAAGACGSHSSFLPRAPRDEAAPHATTNTHATQELHSRFLQLSLTPPARLPAPTPSAFTVVGREGGQDSPTPPPTPTTTPPLHRPCSPPRSRSPPPSLSLPLYLPSPAKTSPSPPPHHSSSPIPPTPVTYAPPPRRALISFSVESIIGKQS
ncbi:hypothetical protein Pmani_039795 [Petrolisthes manimaculis]|uniref:Uncharacterized protein n=1 Tax=Petrolisthes manimaculis TaxID=1843537 RepID=A0AAE1NC17_9EUCA|nr:hypothetical protein Pmani_039795 [Petrolisthes manimaculis]